MLEVLGSGDDVFGDEQGLQQQGPVSCGADLLEDGKGACRGVMGGGIGADGGERRVGVLVEPAELVGDHAGELLGADLAFEAGAPVQGEQGVKEQVALAGEA